MTKVVGFSYGIGLGDPGGGRHVDAVIEPKSVPPIRWTYIAFSGV